ncbi:glutamate dehydrogenase [Arthrobacter stackebrandtii]|uniref:Glutamate dehydrogenase n=1 Tax=Arthrobacter stackebrandtii TaxID=272161 RepID=A0ABS4YZ14_9MICC|nr:NAD-glutamate dehydrogenase [Arthrobacter stackebrandtii]MBP2413720.1 glutamate dehydrogenase [Arthrobacter stackebrandtii]PYH00016.1 glutamate dehydrogenase [Arthrobacter stackebrandtii]
MSSHTPTHEPEQDQARFGGQSFLDDYFVQLSEEDAASYDSALLKSRAFAHQKLAEHRTPGQARMEVLDEPDASVVYIITDDMPFLVDSVSAELVRQNLAIHLVTHPVFVVSRDKSTNVLTSVTKVPSHAGVASGDTSAMPNIAHLLGDGDNKSCLESWIAIEIPRINDAAKDELLTGLARVLGNVRAAVEDWPAMREKALSRAEILATVLAGEDLVDLREAEDLLHWMEADNFTFLGYREYDLDKRDGEDVLVNREGSGLGLLRDGSNHPTVQHLTSTGRKKAREKRVLVITKANSRSTVHRGAYLDYIGVKSFDSQGNVNGEQRFIGLFSSAVYTGSVRNIPVVREKVDAVLRHFGFPPNSHSGKDLFAVLETYPRDELFQIEVADLIEIASGILRLAERRRTRLFLRPDIYGRFMSALVYIPRDRYTTAVRHRIEEELTRTFSAVSIDFEARMSESALARLFFRIRLPKDYIVPADLHAAELQDRLVRAARSWPEGIEKVLRDSMPREQAERLVAKWAEAFPAGYRVDFEVEDALGDIRRFEDFDAAYKQTLSSGLGPEQCAPGMQVYVPEGVGDALEEDARVKLYMAHPESLSKILPFFHNLGIEVLDERPFEIETADKRDFFLYDLGLKYPAGVDPLATAELLTEAFGAAITGLSESDNFDRLVLSEGMHARQIVILRAYAKYMRQMGNTNSFGFIAETLLHNVAVTRGLVELFEARFSPAVAEGVREGMQAEVHERLNAALENVPTLDADRILRTFTNLVDATLRTNYYQGHDYLSFKLDPASIAGLPAPRPMFEIWVYSPRVEGTHLRFGKVARGGLRWSDRREDFRTEVLGLVKAQTVKNAVIVPTGAKGGFFAKQLPNPAVDRGAWIEEGRESYKTFIRGLLDVTDNLVATPEGEIVVPPAGVVRHDGDDSYMVVAADKGTASFSDTANAISAEYGFWLGDAFASGGSVGYDHKAMGITARGAWESVKRHFSEFDVDTQTQEFSAVGVGDMSGDVFGNGLLRTRHVRLVAAFDHRDIFLDPNPVPGVAFDERQRLYDLPRSSWADYNKDLISEGGGVYSRSLKSIPITPQVRAVLGLPEGTERLSPPELLRAVLLAPADLLYNGGIGTYIKASTETNASVGDKANDAIRVDGADLRVKIIGEGGNLGMTQRGRVEAALHGVILNTDAIDNSAGVDCSDHEVNIKIFVDRMVAAGKLKTTERTDFLMSMTDEIGQLVLEDNIEQNILLLNDRQRAVEWSPSYERFMDWLEEHADLDRELEALPNNEELAQRLATGQGLTSPELAVLLAYAKMELAAALSASDLADDPWFKGTLRRYFPTEVAQRFDAELDTHPLRKEIIATVVANDMVNLGGITFAFRAMEESSAGEVVVAKAFVALHEIFDFGSMTAALRELPPSFPTEQWCAVNLDMRRLLDRAVRWLINEGMGTQGIEDVVNRFRPVVSSLSGHMGDFFQGQDVQRVAAWYAEANSYNMPPALGRRWAELFETFPLLDVAKVNETLDEPLDDVAGVYYAIYNRYGVDTLLERITGLPRNDRWQALARAALRDDLYATVADMTRNVMDSTGAGTPGMERIEAWEGQNRDQLDRAVRMFAEVNELEQDDMASLSVALRLLRSIVRR